MSSMSPIIKLIVRDDIKTINDNMQCFDLENDLLLTGNPRLIRFFTNKVHYLLLTKK